MITFDWKWYLRDLPPPDKDVTVFSTFSCGGGSTMGYKRAGFKVLGNVELDEPINEMYVKNHHPKYNYRMDLRDFNALDDLPDELYQLDILDGSPPCSVFSIAGQRDRNWGKEKKFKEGQKKQRLDDLFLVFLETVKKLRPRIVIAENVVGIVQGKAKGYVREIINNFHEAGYDVQIFILNAMYMDVPQDRERVFFIANRFGAPKIDMEFDRPIIPFGQVRTEHGKPFRTEGTDSLRLLKLARPEDRHLGHVTKRLYGKMTGFTKYIAHDDQVAPCNIASGWAFRKCDETLLSDGDRVNTQTFPQDYDFCGNSAQYVCGMSVPPNMMAHIATRVWDRWLAPK